MKAYQYDAFGLENLRMVELPQPEPQAGEVLVKFHAFSLNYRDLMFGRGHYNPRAALPAIPGSDAAGEIVAVGADVKHWKVGDRVCPIFMQEWISGEVTAEAGRSALGAGDRPGVWAEYGVFSETGLVAIPGHLSYEEAATLPCAAVTAWNALVEYGQVKAGDTVLTLGTGGVSIFAIQFAKLHGAHVIATSSSDEKLARAKALGADELINYKNNPDWEKEVLKLTGRKGVDIVIEVGGAGTINKSVASVRAAGRVAVIGVLSGGQGLDPTRVLMKSVSLQGIFVGSRAMFESVNRAVSESQMRPVIDRVFSFAQMPDALRHMESAVHFGKIVVAAS